MLVVEDEACVRRSLVSVLEAEGWRVRDCPGIRDATRSLAEEAADVVLCDLRLADAVSAPDEFPDSFRRTAPMLSDHRHRIENLHKFFPLTVRNPWLMRFVRTLVQPKWMYRPLLVMFMLHAEYLVAEQAMLYAKAQGLGGPRYWTWVDFTLRSVTKGTMRLYQTAFARFSTRLSNAGGELKVKLQMGDERVVAHMD